MTSEAYVKGPLQKLEARELDDRDVRMMLDGVSIERITEWLDPPALFTRYTPTRGNWSQGDPLPALRDDDPAVMQAIGRCAVSRLQGAAKLPTREAIHDERRCAWCSYPVKELLAACDWAVFRSRFVESEMVVWYADQAKRKGPSYLRVTRADVYENPVWAQFWALDQGTRQALIRAAQYPEEAAA